MGDTALIITDMINKMDFDGGQELLKHSLPVAKNILFLKKEVKSEGTPVIYVNDNFGLWQDNTTDLIEECREGRGEEVVNLMVPEDDDYFIIKPKHSGFFGTQLGILLNQLEVKKLIITGIAGDICVLFTANDAYMREYDLWVPSNCVASENKERNEHALQIIKHSLSANVEDYNGEKIDI